MLTAQQLLRANNEHRILDLSHQRDRSEMAESLVEMDLLELHDVHCIVDEHNTFPDGQQLNAPKISIEQMEIVCQRSDSYLHILKKRAHT